MLSINYSADKSSLWLKNRIKASNYYSDTVIIEVKREDMGKIRRLVESVTADVDSGIFLLKKTGKVIN